MNEELQRRNPITLNYNRIKRSTRIKNLLNISFVVYQNDESNFYSFSNSKVIYLQRNKCETGRAECLPETVEYVRIQVIVF